MPTRDHQRLFVRPLFSGRHIKGMSVLHFPTFGCIFREIRAAPVRPPNFGSPTTPAGGSQSGGGADAASPIGNRIGNLCECSGTYNCCHNEKEGYVRSGQKREKNGQGTRSSTSTSNRPEKNGLRRGMLAPLTFTICFYFPRSFAGFFLKPCSTTNGDLTLPACMYGARLCFKA